MEFDNYVTMHTRMGWWFLLLSVVLAQVLMSRDRDDMQVECLPLTLHIGAIDVIIGPQVMWRERMVCHVFTYGYQILALCVWKDRLRKGYTTVSLMYNCRMWESSFTKVHKVVSGVS